MQKNNFKQRKKDVLSRRDKSSKGGWDENIVDLCEKINSLENYYTTSSCAGRAVLIFERDKKEHGLFVKVYHDKISFEELKKDLDEAVENVGTLRVYPEIFSTKIFTKGIKFKMEACALHVACESLEDAQSLYDKAKLAGWKRSGIIATGDRFMVELNSTEKLEFPIINEGKVLVDDEFLKLVVEESNRKLQKSWDKIERLKGFL
jgi:tRNA wybutosine-synthesizing protein 3